MQGDCVIVGGGHAASQLAVALRANGWTGGVTIVAEESEHPYYRPPLSKECLTGEKSPADISIRPRAAYERLNVRLCLGVRAESIDRRARQVLLSNGDSLRYSRLALATGASVRKLAIPGATLPGVCYLRTIADATAIRHLAEHARHVVVIGGGYIGLETAASMRKRGLDVTVIESADRLLQRVIAADVGSFFERVHVEQGVHLHTGASVLRLEGTSRVESVVCADGRAFPADFVVVGVGVVPQVELAQDAGLSVDDGIIIDRYACTNDPDIVAAGDCTRHYSLLYERSVRLESVQNAVDQANVAAATICGDRRPYDALPWFWSNQYDVKLQIAGLAQHHDQVVFRGDARSGRSFAAFYLQRGRLLAVDAVNRPREFMAAKRLVAAGCRVEPGQLADEQIDLKTLGSEA